MFSPLVLTFLSSVSFAHEMQPKLLADRATSMGIWSAALGTPIFVGGSIFFFSGIMSGDGATSSGGLVLQGVGMISIIGGSTSMLLGNELMIQDLQRYGGTVDRAALNWSYALMGVMFASSVSVWYMPDEISPYLALGGLTAYASSIVATVIQRNRTRRSYEQLKKKNTKHHRSPQLRVRPMIGHQQLGLVGYF